MSVHRMTLRMAAIMALNNFGRAPWPTLAENSIFDSKIDPQETTEGGRAAPVCVVYTDYDKDFVRHGHSPKKPRVLTLTLEIIAVQVSPDTDDEGNPLTDDHGNQIFMISAPATDSELETTLDVFELQVFDAFLAASAAADCVSYLIGSGFESVISRRGASVEGGTRLAARQITIEAHVPRDPMPPNLPQPIETFLAELDEVEAYAPRAALLRGLYRRNEALTSVEQLRQHMGWSRGLTDLLGYDRGPVARLASPIVWLNNDGTPL